VPKQKKQVGVAHGASGARFRCPGESDDLGEEDQVVVDLEGDGDGDSESGEDKAVLEEALKHTKMMRANPFTIL